MPSLRKKYKASQYWQFQFMLIQLDWEFDPIISYLEKSEQMINLVGKELETKFLEWDREQKQNPDLPDAFDFYEKEVMEYDQFSKVLYNSVFLMLYSLFESQYVNICNNIRRAEGYKLGVKDLSGGNYIDQCRRYIEKVSDTSLDSLNQEWSIIKKYQRIRNSITHSDGFLKEVKPDLKQFIENSDGIIYNQEKQQIEIESIDFLKSFILILKKYLSQVTEEFLNSRKAN